MLSREQVRCLQVNGLLPRTGTAEVAGPRMTELATTYIETEKAVGTQPLWRVQYTSKAGRTDTYGVFWSGPCKKTGEHKLGLKPLTNSGQMYKWNPRNRYSKGFFVLATDTIKV